MKTRIEEGKYEMPAAALYGDNRLPDVYNNAYLQSGLVPKGIDAEDSVYIGKGFVKTVLPYTIQDDYDREKKPRKFISVTMENDYLKAVILPEIGGRIWSLYDKKRGKDLVFENPVFQPCNFAPRNAWVAGGIEFNVGIRGHSVFTSSTVFCKVREYKDGRKTVVLYEYERIRGIVWSVELYLPDDGDTLFARVTVENASDERKHMYWWTNIAVAQLPELRVLAPARQYFLTSYEDGINYLSLRNISDRAENIDPAYPALNSRFSDFFYKIPENKDKWIVSADAEGYGLAHTSDNMLKGRKFFAMGTKSRAGRNWAEFLSVKGEKSFYAEIQAGLTYTQFEHVQMPPNTTWQWMEAFTPFQGNGLTHSSDILTAQREAERRLKMNGAKIKELNVFDGMTPENKKSGRTVTLGSSWGYIENRIRERLGLKQISGAVSFSFMQGGPEQGWMDLIQNGRFKAEDVTEPPESFMTGAYITELLKKAAGSGGAYTYLQLGTALFAAEKHDEALAAWEKSFKLKPNAWAARNIAMLKRHFRDYDAACGWMQKAICINSKYRPLIIDCAKVLTEAKKYGDWLEIYDKLEPKLKNIGRVKYITATAYMGLDMLEETEGLLNKDLVIDDLLEGELSLEKLWEELYVKKIRKETGAVRLEDIRIILHKKYPLPPELNFRINVKA